jgi:hypothetical protein
MPRELNLSNNELVAYMAQEYFRGGYFHQNELPEFIAKVSDPAFFAPLVSRFDNSLKHTENWMRRTPNAYFTDDQLDMLNGLKAMKPEEVGQMFDAVLSQGGIDYWSKTRGVVNLYSQSGVEPGKLSPVVPVTDGGELSDLLKMQVYENLTGKRAESIDVAVDYYAQNYEKTLPEFTRLGGLVQCDQSKLVSDRVIDNDGIVLIVPSALSEKERSYFDYTHGDALEQAREASAAYQATLTQQTDKLLEKSREPAIVQQRANNLRNHFPDERILQEELQRPQRAIENENPLLPEMRSMDTIKGMTGGKQALWQLKQKEMSPEEFFREFDPQRADSPLKKHLDQQPSGTQREIRNMIQYMKQHPEMVEKYGVEGVLDQFYIIIRDRVEGRARDLPELQQSIEKQLQQHYRGAPSGNRCPSCDEELRQHYNTMQQAVFAAKDLAPFNDKHNEKSAESLLAGFRKQMAGRGHEGGVGLS